jgi:hypothetical protein
MKIRLMVIAIAIGLLLAFHPVTQTGILFKCCAENRR